MFWMNTYFVCYTLKQQVHAVILTVIHLLQILDINSIAYFVASRILQYYNYTRKQKYCHRLQEYTNTWSVYRITKKRIFIHCWVILSHLVKAPSTPCLICIQVSIDLKPLGFIVCISISIWLQRVKVPKAQYLYTFCRYDFWNVMAYAAMVNTCFSANCGKIWSTKSGWVSTLHLIVIVIFVLS